MENLDTREGRPALPISTTRMHNIRFGTIFLFECPRCLKNFKNNKSLNAQVKLQKCHKNWTFTGIKIIIVQFIGLLFLIYNLSLKTYSLFK